MADNEFTTYGEEDWRQQAYQDELAIQNVLAADTEQQGGQPLLDLNRPLDVGEKADDAEDYEDIELSDEEEEQDIPQVKQETGHLDNLFGDDDDDDLFGDGGRDTSPVADDQLNGRDGIDIDLGVEPEPEIDPEALMAMNFPDQLLDPETGENIVTDPAAIRELVAKNFPSFRDHCIPEWTTLFPHHEAKYIPPEPLHAPKPLHPTKIGLEIGVDQEKLFRSTAPIVLDKNKKRKRGNDAHIKKLVMLKDDVSEKAESDDEFDYDPIELDDKVGGYTLKDLEYICADFESMINRANSEAPSEEEEEDTPLDEWEREILGEDYVRPKKKQKSDDDFEPTPSYPVPDFDNFLAMAHQVAKRPLLDMNDPYLLLDIDWNPAKRQKLDAKPGDKSFASTLTKRFNYSNDEAYQALKENHQSKVRAALGSTTAEHSLPALKLQWPFYRTTLRPEHTRAYHRPALKFLRCMNQPIFFSKPNVQRKRKTVKGMQILDIFATSKDLSLSEHYASATLFEYSEENPTVLTNFGMGNRVINHYRKKTADDPDRPQPDDKIGDLAVLLPEDRSPFANFGMVDPGETVRAIHNAMYRAPIFKHEVKPTDFLCVRSTTGVDGSHWYLRNIDNIFVVGQQFPNMEVPGPHSRRVTNAQKNRMRMLSHRFARHNSRNEVKIADITAHIAGSSDMQNRQKLKDFMTYDKTEKVWKLRADDPLREEAQIRTMVSPEDVCAIDAMQVGVRYLEDAGLVADEVVEDAANNNADDEDEEGNIEQKLAPWRTTKTFIEASADKAMLALVGPGDPTGCGAALSFLKTSMKGGFLENLQKADFPELVEDVKRALDPKNNGGHTYNVKHQQDIYNKAIRSIWERQKAGLSSNVEDDESDYAAETPAVDDTASQYSANNRRKALRITRAKSNQWGQRVVTTEVVTDPKVIAAYMQKRTQLDMQTSSAYEVAPTGDAEFDKMRLEIVQKELERLKKNEGRRHAREKQKGKGINRSVSPSSALSPASTPAPSIEKPAGTTRKCANCGEIGHIKTNKKYYCQSCAPPKPARGKSKKKAPDADEDKNVFEF